MSDHSAVPAPSSFVDKNGIEHKLELTYGDALRIKKKFGVDLLDINDGKVFVELGANGVLLISVVWEITSSAENREDETAIESFADALDGPTIERMALALRDAIILFSPPAKRPALRALFGKADSAIERTGEAMLEVIESDETQEALDLIISEQVKTAKMRVGLNMAKAVGANNLEKAPRRTMPKSY